MGRDEKRRFKPNKKHFELAKEVAIKERRNGPVQPNKETPMASSKAR
jgi:hypothetical protein